MTAVAVPPGPKVGSVLGHALAIRRDPLAFVASLVHDYGDVVLFKMGSLQVFVVSDPVLISEILAVQAAKFHKGRAIARLRYLLGNGLLTSEGDFHRRQRRLANPAFHRQRIAAYAETMVDFAQSARDRWQPGQTVDMTREMSQLTLAIAAKTLFNTTIPAAEVDALQQAITSSMRVYLSYAPLPLAEHLIQLPLPGARHFQDTKRIVTGIIDRVIDEHLAAGVDQGDLLSMLLTSEDEDGSGTMNRQQAADEAKTFWIAGYETLAVALTWTWYLLSQHPDVAVKLHAELDQALGGQLPTLADVPQLTYTEMVLAESMRLYPPLYGVTRRAIADVQLGPYQVPKGANVVVSEFVVHRDARWWPDPERFDPERFTPEAKASRPKFAYFPFGGGPRMCIGESFAWMEGVLVLATLAQGWTPQLAPTADVQLNPLVTLRPRYGMPMTLVPRPS